MGSYAVAYLSTFLVFTALDVTWLTLAGAAMFKRQLSGILLTKIRRVPAAAFYALYPFGLVLFAVMPAVESGGASAALLKGALFGLFSYATYDLTNHATLRNWTARITIVDIACGTSMGALAAAAGYFAVTAMT